MAFGHVERHLELHSAVVTIRFVSTDADANQPKYLRQRVQNDGETIQYGSNRPVEAASCSAGRNR